MNTLPLELENIIMNYRNQLEHTAKFKKCLNQLKQIEWVESISFGVMEYVYDLKRIGGKDGIVFSYLIEISGFDTELTFKQINYGIVRNAKLMFDSFSVGYSQDESDDEEVEIESDYESDDEEVEIESDYESDDEM